MNVTAFQPQAIQNAALTVPVSVHAHMGARMSALTMTGGSAARYHFGIFMVR